MVPTQIAAAPSVFDAADNAALLARIDRLTPQTQPRWGRMSAAQMLAHCRQPLLVATGEKRLKRGWMGILFGKLAKKKLAGPEPFKRGLPTAPAFVIRDACVFEDERRQLRALVARFTAEGPAVLSREPHPFFGPLTTEEWDRLQWKHLDHHLRQFGV